MEFKDQIRILGERVAKLKDQVNTEEATKNAFIMPFISQLGYDVFNPTEVTPELIADVGGKVGEKIDYAILKDGQPIILIECKHHGAALTVKNASQLLRYFHTTTAKFSILTNGIEFKFYTDLDVPNKMDEKPFFAFDITDIRDNQIEELKKFHKSFYDFENILTTASDLKYSYELKKLFLNEFNEPSEDFVVLFAKQVHKGVVTKKVKEQFSVLLKKSLQQHLSDQVTERLKSALTKEVAAASDHDVVIEPAEYNIVTTQEEVEAFLIVKTILRANTKSDRIVYRDAQSYFAVLLDDNNRKTICRLYLNGKKKCIGTFNGKTETKNEIQSIDEIYDYAEALKTTVAEFDKVQ